MGDMDRKKRTLKTINDYGKVSIDLGKLIFGSLVLGTTIKGSLDQYVLLASGLAATAVFIVLGIWLTNMTREE